MAETSKIEWTDATWNPITGCTLVSEGCRNCYAARLAATRMKHHPSRAGLARLNRSGEAKFTGEVRFNEKWLDQPLRWKKPKRIFVCAHGDLFHEKVPDAWIDRVFAVMAMAPQHTFQVLTKRPERMREYITHACGRVADAVQPLRADDRPVGPLPHLDGGMRWWPLPNVWLGVSAEDQATAAARIPPLLAIPAAVRFVSAEPLLGPINLRRLRVAPDHHTMVDALDGYAIVDTPGRERERAALHWVICGGESGRGARPMHPHWARSLRDQCATAGVPFFVKQLSSGGPKAIKEIDAFPEGLRVREFPA